LTCVFWAENAQTFFSGHKDGRPISSCDGCLQVSVRLCFGLRWLNADALGSVEGARKNLPIIGHH
jgi:hypothetical protein